ncbi:MAG: class I SAM-dependent rRNA methyltransferase [Lewinellaceae bacterium]|nr:class I SAM-dependent rRNA methyltransferase [Lewinellaceae bacterium]
MKKLTLKPKKEDAIRRFHPWIFSGAIARTEAGITEGEWVEVCSAQGETLGFGHYQQGSICVRLLTFGPEPVPAAFWQEKIAQAYTMRQALGLVGNDQTSCYRLVHGEGDGLPGLIIDIYDRTAVVQCHSIGMHADRAEITAALRNIYADQLISVYDKSVETLPSQYAGTCKNEYLWGTPAEALARENGHSFYIDWEGGQKTGFFLDQRENRRLLGSYAAGKSVLNAYCYSGGFSIYALAAGATHVDSVDASARAIELVDRNVAANPVDASRHQAHTADVLSFLRQQPELYDIIIVDPPAFAKSREKRHNAVQGYKRLNAQALKQVKPGGLLFTFSCSQVVDKPLFYNTIVAAAIEAGRQVRVLHQLSQGPDHPVSLFHPEGDYLKGLVLYVA